MNFGEILLRAWKIIWKHKILWIFGILASCGQSGGSAGSGASGSSSASQSLFTPMQLSVNLGDVEFLVLLLIIAAAVVFLFLLMLAMVALNAVGRIGLVCGVVQAEAGKEKLSLGELLSEVKPFFWRVVGLNLLVGASVIVLVIAGIAVSVIVAIVTLGIGLLLIIPLALFAVPLMWAVTVVLEQANVALIVEDIGILEALKRAWLVIKAHFIEYLLMGLVLILGVGLLGMVIIALPVLLVAVPLVVGAMIDEMFWSVSLAAIVCCAVYLPILIVLTGVLRSYITTAWTLTYLRLAGPIPPAPVSPPETVSKSGPGLTASPEKQPESLPDPLTGTGN